MSSARARAVLARARRRTESLFTDQCTLQRETDDLVTDPETGQTTQGFEDRATDLPCKVQSSIGQGNHPSSGEHQYTVESLKVHLPIGTDAWSGDEVVITASATDPDNVGLIFKLTTLERGTYRTAQRWNVEVMTR